MFSREISRAKICFFPCPRSKKAQEVGLVSRPASVRSFSTPRLNLVLTHGLSSPCLAPAFRATTVSIFTVNHHRVSPEFIRSRDCVPMAFIAESPPAQEEQVYARPFSQRSRTINTGACHYLTNRFQMEAPVAPSRSLREASVGMAEAFAKPSRSLLGGFSKPSAPARSS